jgi:hypothetical protein
MSVYRTGKPLDYPRSVGTRSQVPAASRANPAPPMLTSLVPRMMTRPPCDIAMGRYSPIKVQDNSPSLAAAIEPKSFHAWWAVKRRV